ncbi:MAG: LytR cell envelope-related transcriptional attenuator [Actinomycetota bacterium]|jgi:hypothetical protein|nr:LytR cell envelope-related transcriptional attenuator [Actinomycetota bacterium]
MARGVALIVVAVLLGVILLRATSSSEPFTNVNSKPAAGAHGVTGTTQATGRGGTTPTTAPQAARNPATVTVLVANGANVNGLASKIADKLKAANYVTAQPGNTKAPADVSVVYYAPGYEADARAVAALLRPVPKVAPLADPPPVDDMKGANILVVAAADLARSG